jgi:exopolysaccharide biosynthesis polyprenyl glycosylphosphotransferase
MRPASRIEPTSGEPTTPPEPARTDAPPLEAAGATAAPSTQEKNPTSSAALEAEPAPRFAAGFAAKLNLVVDLLLVAVALLASTALMGHALRWERADMWALLGVGMGTWLLVGTALCLYDVRFADRERLDDLALVSITVMVVTVVLLLSRLVMGTDAGVVALSFFPVMLWPAVTLPRQFIFKRLSVREAPLDEVLIIGVGPMGRLTGEDLSSKHRRKVIGHLSLSGETAASAMQAPVLGSVKELERLLCTVPVDEVYVAGNMFKHTKEIQEAIKLCENLGIPFALPAYPFRLDRAQPIADHKVENGYLHFRTHAFQPRQLALKRLFDIVSSAGALVMLSPLLVGVALGVKLSSRGPIFFKQKRVGLHGKPFYMLKFRSMVVNAEELKAKLEAQNEQTGPVFKMKNDPRITGIGRFIRKYSIDELPQLINVLRGEMSVVGPRPPIPGEVEKYAAWQRRRLSVRPGLTCIWQVSGRNQISFEEWMYLDMQYIDHWSLKNDINLILKTVPVVLTGSGAS